MNLERISSHLQVPDRMDRDQYSYDTVRVALWKDQNNLSEIGRLRSKVWREQEGVWVPDFADADPDVWLDHDDAAATHFAAYVGDELIGAARITFHDDLHDMIDGEHFAQICSPTYPIASLNRLVVLQEHRKKGVAKLLDRARIEEAIRRGVKTVFLVAVGENRSQAVADMGFQELMKFPEGHGLVVPERPLTAFFADPKQLRL